MNNRKRGFGNPDFLLLLLVAGLILGGFYFVFRAPAPPPAPAGRRPAAEAPVRPLLAEKTPAGKVPEVSPRPPAESGPEKPAAGRQAVPPPVENDAGEEAACAIEGTVFSLASGMPLARCEVRFMDLTVVTGEDGEFHLAADGGVGILRFACSGYRPEMIFRFDIGAGSGMASFNVYLSSPRDARRGRIEINGLSGRVYDKATGAPLTRAWVTVGRKRTRTDKAGFFELWGLDTGLASLRVSAPDHIGEMISGIDLDNLLNPLYYEIFLESSAGGKFHFALVGIGARLMSDPEKGGCVIAAVLDDSPAAREGLEPGDRLLAVDGVAVDDASPAEVVELIRGREGKPVDLLVERQGELLRFTCIRERVLY